MLDSYRIPSTKAERAAKALLAKHYIFEPYAIDLEGILAVEGGYLFYKPLVSAQGRIVLKQNSAIITVNSNIASTRKQRFILAHEIGHFILHRLLTKRTYTCYARDLINWSNKTSVETEANEFAAALLMPASMFKEATYQKGLSLSTMQKLQDMFNTSFTATGIRYTQCGDVPAAIVVMTNGLIELAKFSEDFPGQYIPFKTKIPYGTIAYEVFQGEDPPSSPSSVLLRDWFTDGLKRQFSNWKINELCLSVPKYNMIISMLWSY